MKKWLPGFALLSVLFSLSGAYAEEPAGSQPPVYEAALLISDNQLIPAEIYIPEGEDLRLHVLNIGKLAGQFTVPGLKEEKSLKTGKVETFTLPAAMIAQGAKCQFACQKSNFNGAVSLSAGLPEAGKTVEIALIGQRLKFYPENAILVLAGQPLKISLYALTSIPHKDFMIYGTDIKLPFKNKELTTVDIPKGLAAGTYLLSRPKFSQQKHGIKTRFEVVETSEE